MPRKTRRQLVGKQEDIERQEREDVLRALEWELHLMQSAKSGDFLPETFEPAEDVISLLQAEIMLLTVPTRTATRQK